MIHCILVRAAFVEGGGVNSKASILGNIKNHASSGHASSLREEHCFRLSSKNVSQMMIRQDVAAAAASPGIKLFLGQRKLFIQGWYGACGIKLFLCSCLLGHSVNMDTV